MNQSGESIRRLVASDEAFYTPLVHQVKEECRELIIGFRDRPEWVSGWGHAFACPACAAKMTFQEDLDYQEPNSFFCSHCGQTASGEALDHAWVFYYRHFTAGHLEAVAVCALLGDVAARVFLERYFDFYAQHYQGFAVHGKDGGKLMPQLLDEAVWCLRVLRALYPTRELFSAQKRQEWYEKLFRPLVELIDAPDGQHGIHNHTLWHKCAVGAVAICFDDPQLLEHALNGPLGIAELTEKGMTEDGMWFESSPHYHYYAMEALTAFCQFLGCVQKDHPLLGLLEKAYVAPMTLSHDGWTIPCFNDGWYPLCLGKYADQVQRAAATLQSKPLLEQVERIRQHGAENLNAAAVLLLDAAAEAQTVIWEATRMAVVKAPAHAILKAGSLNNIHMHRDCLSLVLPPFSVNLGTPGYGHPLYRGWYTLAASHNTIAVDLDQPHEAIETRVEAVPGGVRAVVVAGWPGVKTASRTLTVDGEALVDRTEVVCEGEHTIDWIFHTDHSAFVAALGSEVKEWESECGYEHFTDVRQRRADSLDLFNIREDCKLYLQADTRGLEVYTALSPGNPATEKRKSLILRARGDRAVFTVRYIVKKR